MTGIALRRHLFQCVTLGAALRLMGCSSAESTDESTEDLGEGAGLQAACGDLGEAAAWHMGEQFPSTAASTPERVSTMGATSWQVALDMLAVVPHEAQQNLLQSPASMMIALGMGYARWQGRPCGERILATMGYPEANNDLHHTLGASIRELESRSLPASEGSDALEVNLSQSTWLFRETIFPEPTELDSIYGATPNLLGAPNDAARKLVNCVINEQSQGLIQDFLTPGSLDPNAGTLDINVTFLAAPWAQAFIAWSVPFSEEGKALKQVEGMGSSSIVLDFFEAPTFNAVEIPLKGNELVLQLIVPNDEFTGGLEAFSASLDAPTLKQAREAATARPLQFEMPKVDIKPVMVDYYESLGFDCEPFTLLNVFHGGAIEIDEKGLKAAAVTVVVGDGDSSPELPEESFSVDRPFLFFIYDQSTDFVLFSGRYGGATD